MSPRLLHPDGRKRCPWPKQDPLYVAYHDEEWGVPEYDDRALYEKLILDGFQAGLSWITILRKRENFRRAFDGFDQERMLGDGEDVRALGLPVPTGNSREPMGDVCDLDVERRGVEQVEPAP